MKKFSFIKSMAKFFIDFMILTSFFLIFLNSEIKAQENSPGNLILVLDASGSMWQKVQGEFKIAVARKVLKNLLNELPSDVNVGFIAYGHRRKGDCADIETVVPLAALNKATLSQKVDALDPKGKTPITDAIKVALETAKSNSEETIIILVSDGLETCGGDPCATVEAAKKAGIKFITHVIGFDMAKENVASLECAAQAGGGLYFSANNADELADALKKTATAEIPPGRLSIKSSINGKLQDTSVKIYKAGTREWVVSARTYASPQTNPRIIPLPVGQYDIEVRAIGLRGNVSLVLSGVDVRADSVVIKEVDFSPGELRVTVTRNGQLSDATVNVYRNGDAKRENVARGRTYTSANSNPKVFTLTPGTYDVIIASVEVSGKPQKTFENITISGGSTVEKAHDFASGTLKIGAVNGMELVDVTVGVMDIETNKSVAQGRTYTNANSNPRTFEISPGKYRVRVGAVKLEGRPRREVELTVEAGKVTTHIVDFSK